MTEYVFVDYENVQPPDLSHVAGSEYHVKVFVGAKQARIPLALATALQSLGPRAEYLLIQSSGRNALDFHIAYYLGVLSSRDTAARFHIISGDTGFDPLIEHLNTRGVSVRRHASIASMPCKQQSGAGIPPSRLQVAVAHLGKLKAAKPRTRKTLMSTLHALFRRELSEEQLATLFEQLCETGVVKADGGKVSYAIHPPT